MAGRPRVLKPEIKKTSKPNYVSLELPAHGVELTIFHDSVHLNVNNEKMAMAIGTVWGNDDTTVYVHRRTSSREPFVLDCTETNKPKPVKIRRVYRHGHLNEEKKPVHIFTNVVSPAKMEKMEEAGKFVVPDWAKKIFSGQ
jgi:hypothetical protein